jgi:glycosyltransferase involved in cell wall biosynthesis
VPAEAKTFAALGRVFFVEGFSEMDVVSNARVEFSTGSATPSAGPATVTRFFIPLVTPYLYGMERAVIELFDALRPAVEPYFLQSNRIFQRQPPIIREMTRRGFSIELLPDETDWERLARPQSIKHLWQMVTTAVRCNIAIFRGVRGKDVLYVPSISAGSSSLLGAIWCRLTGRRVIHHFHDLGTTNRLFPFWIRLVTDFVHNTEFGLETIAARFPAIKRKRNFIVPYIVEINDQLPEDRELCRQFTGKRNFFFVGQVSRHKGIDLLVQALKLVAPMHQDLVLHLVGGCSDDFRLELDREISGAGLEGRVRFWGFREDATRLMRFAYLYVHPSPPSRFHESFGRSVVEAMAHGVPTVCFRSGALQEIVLHEKTGLICEENVFLLAAAFNRFLDEPDFRDACGREAAQRFEREYCLAVVRPRWERLVRTAED